METSKKTILFVTGSFVTHHCWDEWKTYFEKKGYNTIAPPWPFKDGTAAELRARQPNDVDLATLTVSEVIDSYAKVASSLPEKPYIIGHSFGGMMTQVLNNRGLARAAVVIHSVPTLGVFPYEFTFLRSTWKSLGLFTSVRKTYLMSFKDWQYAFVNGMPLDQQQKGWEQLTIPESKTVSRGGLTSAAKVDYDKSHAPLLFVAGSEDQTIPAHLNRRNFKRYKQNGSVLEYKEFPGRNHFVLGQPGWEGNADYVADWIAKH